jgi:Arc-like DNA binding domain
MAARKKNRPVQFNVRIAAELRDNLNRAAKQNGVSLNVETTKRLGASFAEAKAFGGEAGRRWMYHITTMFVFAGERYYRDHIKPKQQKTDKNADQGPNVALWIEEPEAYQAAMMDVIEQLMRHQPGATWEKCKPQLDSLTGRIATYFLRKGQTP